MTPAAPASPQQDDRGFSLVELLVAAAVGCVVLALVLGVLIGAQQQTAATASTGEAVGDVRLVTAVLQRQVRSASAPIRLQPPVVSGAPAQGFGYSTRTGADGRPTAAPQCLQFAVVGGALRTRRFPAASTTRPAWASAPVLVAGVVAGSASAPTAGTSFAADAAEPATVSIHLRVRRPAGRVVALDTVLAPRDDADAVDTSGCANFTD